jgi:hypothetical protein
MPRLTATERKLKEEVAIAEAHAQELLQRVADLKSASDSAAEAAIEAASAAAEVDVMAIRALAAEDEARRQADAAAAELNAAEAEAENATKAAYEARMRALFPFTPTKGGGNRSGNSAARMWDVQVAVHCIKPTGKPAACSQYDVGKMLDETRLKLEQLKVTIVDKRQRLADASVAVRRCGEAEEAAKQEYERVLEEQAALIEQQKMLETGGWKPPMTPAGAEAAQSAWLATLNHLRDRLERLHSEGYVEYAVLGFVRSDAHAWRRFWTRQEVVGSSGDRSSSGGGAGDDGSPIAPPQAGFDSPRKGSGFDSPRKGSGQVPTDRVECAYPKTCGCALCAHRWGKAHRSGAHPSIGEGGVFDAFTEFRDAKSEAHKHAEGLGARVGTRVCGVVRVCAESAEAGIRFVSGQLCAALHEARPVVLRPTMRTKRDLMSMRRDEMISARAFEREVVTNLKPDNLRKMGLYDVMWQEQISCASTPDRGADMHALVGSSSGFGSSVLGVGGGGGGGAQPRLKRSNSMPMRGARTAGAASPSDSPSSTASTSPTGKIGAPMRLTKGHTRGASSSTDARGGGNHRPLLTNPHASLLLDVHTRLLRTDGNSFSYMSGRAQLDTDLPWIGIGREERAFVEDRKSLMSSTRPLSPRPGRHGLQPSSPRSMAREPRTGQAALHATEGKAHPLWYVAPSTPHATAEMEGHAVLNTALSGGTPLLATTTLSAMTPSLATPWAPGEEEQAPAAEALAPYSRGWPAGEGLATKAAAREMATSAVSSAARLRFGAAAKTMSKSTGQLPADARAAAEAAREAAEAQAVEAAEAEPISHNTPDSPLVEVRL